MKFNFSRWGDYLYQYNSLQDLQDIDLITLSSGVFQFNHISSYLNFYIKNFEIMKTNTSKKLLVGFGGALSTRDPNTMGPFFSFGTIASELNIPLISFSDSSLYLDNNIKLAWYTGGVSFQRQQRFIAKIIETICLRYNLEPILCGGSGGGFASLAISTFLEIEHQCLVWNPQTSIQKYYNRYVDTYIETCYPNFKSKSRATQFSQIEKYGIVHDVTSVALNNNAKILYLQNLTDKFHVDNHCFPFLKKHLFEEQQNKDQFFKYTLYSNKLILGCNWGIGHIPPNQKQLLYLLSNLINDRFLDEVSDEFLQILKCN